MRLLSGLLLRFALKSSPESNEAVFLRWDCLAGASSESDSSPLVSSSRSVSKKECCNTSSEMEVMLLGALVLMGTCLSDDMAGADATDLLPPFSGSFVGL
jgi:hypothetical protein